MEESLIPINIFDFIKHLKLSKKITTKQLPFIENINFYINNCVIYKYIIAVRPEMFKRAKRFGLESLFNVYCGINVKINEPIPNTSIGRFILMYNPGNCEITVADGEDLPNNLALNTKKYHLNFKG